MGPCTRARSGVSKSRKVDIKKQTINQFQNNISATKNLKNKKTRRCCKKIQEANEDNSNIATPPLSPVKSYNNNETQTHQGINNTTSFNCSTPKSEKSRIPEITTCPPAPKKRKIIRSGCSSLKRTPVSFYATPELELFFLYGLPKI